MSGSNATAPTLQRGGFWRFASFIKFPMPASFAVSLWLLGGGDGGPGLVLRTCCRGTTSHKGTSTRTSVRGNVIEVAVLALLFFPMQGLQFQQSEYIQPPNLIQIAVIKWLIVYLMHFWVHLSLSLSICLSLSWIKRCHLEDFRAWIPTCLLHGLTGVAAVRNCTSGFPSAAGNLVQKHLEELPRMLNNQRISEMPKFQIQRLQFSSNWPPSLATPCSNNQQSCLVSPFEACTGATREE